MIYKNSIAKRLRNSFLFLAGLVALNGLIGIFSTNQVSRDADFIFQEQFPIAEECYELEKEILLEVVAVHSMLLGEDSASERYNNFRETSEEQIKNLESEFKSANAIQSIAEVASLHKQFGETIATILKAEAGSAAFQMLEVKLEEEMMDLLDKCGILVNQVEANMLSAMENADQSQNTALIVLAVLSLLSLVIAYFVGQKVSAGITTPLSILVRQATSISKGELSNISNLEVTEDELGLLNDAFNEIVSSQRKITNTAESISKGNLRENVELRAEQDSLGIALRQMIQSLRNQIGTLMEGTNTISSSVSEISSSSAQLASSAAENATAISETTSTIEEVRQTTELSSQKSKKLADDAHTNSSVAKGGRASTRKTIEAMEQIKNQMSTVAETIIGLSQQSQSIGQIIASVDAIAEQSNVLAVNASIEAAKAGEQGKGFAVVAREVKNLAEQSKQATRQVRDILNEIQQSTNTAILATEEGTKVVEKGKETAVNGGEAIDNLAKSVDNSADIAMQIAAASQQQSIGMDQISSAMDNVREASQQNASSAQQLETAVQNLNRLGEDLKHLVSQYQT